MKLVVLYEELADYFIACCTRLAAKYDVEIHIVRKEINKEAPFEFDAAFPGKLYARNKYDTAQLLQLAEEIEPDAILCGGWSDKAYLNVCRKFNKKIPVFVGFDNKWNGSFRQRVAAVTARFYFKDIFSYCFVPGKEQVRFAVKLGYSKENIFTGAYSCDQEKFAGFIKQDGTGTFPKRFIFVGRYVEQKGIRDLWDAFIQLKSEKENDWELWCLGTGDIPPVQHPSIKHFGFVQPNNLGSYMQQSGVFILPSLKEPWGVALHEFAAAGFPLICSDQVGAAEAFLEEGRNGYSFAAGNKEALKDRMRRIIASSDEELIKMGKISSQLSEKISPTTWAETVFTIMNK